MMNYNYDVLTNTLTASEKFLKAAGKYNSPEYNLVKKYRADNPAMQIVVAKKQKGGTKNLTFNQMEDFINVVDKSKADLFKKVKAISRVQSSPYHYVKTWFEHQFPNYTEQVLFGEDGTITFLKKEENAAAGADAEKPAPEEHHEAEGTPAADAGDNASGDDAAA